MSGQGVFKNTTPKNNDQAVCRNASIEAFFSKPMAVNNLSNNVLLIADYGTQESCPNGTTYLASADSLLKDSWWGRLKNRLLAWLRPDVLSAELEDVLPVGPAVEDHTYCALNKTIKVKDKRLIIQPSGILPANRLIFVVLITDSNLQDGQAEGIIDQHGIGLAGGQPLQFNNLHLRLLCHGHLRLVTKFAVLIMWRLILLQYCFPICKLAYPLGQLPLILPWSGAVIILSSI